MSDQGVTVEGRGAVAVSPDILLAKVGAEVTANSVQAALDRCSTALTAMVDVLRTAGVADRDRQTGGARVHQAYDNSGTPNGWTASQQLTARLRDLGTAGDLVGAVVAAAGDAARLHDLGFAVDDPAEARREARDLAYADALATATRYAELAGRTLGPVQAMRDGGAADPGGQPPRPMLRAAYGGGPAGPAVEAGELEITAVVEVRWGLAT